MERLTSWHGPELTCARYQLLTSSHVALIISFIFYKSINLGPIGNIKNYHRRRRNDHSHETCSPGQKLLPHLWSWHLRGQTRHREAVLHSQELWCRNGEIKGRLTRWQGLDMWLVIFMSPILCSIRYLVI